jgi:hypothetical protein
MALECLLHCPTFKVLKRHLLNPFSFPALLTFLLCPTLKLLFALCPASLSSFAAASLPVPFPTCKSLPPQLSVYQIICLLLCLSMLVNLRPVSTCPYLSVLTLSLPLFSSPHLRSLDMPLGALLVVHPHRRRHEVVEQHCNAHLETPTSLVPVLGAWLSFSSYFFQDGYYS